MTAKDKKCDCCNGESGGEYVGVACIPGQAMSIAWCNNCLNAGATPRWINVFVYFWIGTEGEGIADWAKLPCWHEGKYIDWAEFVESITPEEREKELEGLAAFEAYEATGD